MTNQSKLQPKWYEQSKWIAVLFVLFFPAALYLLSRRYHWSKRTNIVVSIASALIVIVALAGSGSNHGSLAQISPKTSSPTSATQAASPASSIPQALPVISVDGATAQGNDLNLAPDGAKTTFKVKAENVTPTSSDTVTVNGVAIPSTGTFMVRYPYTATLQPGQNTFTIVAKNKAGQASKQLTITYDPAALTTSQKVDAEATCQEYAQGRLLVKNINMSLIAESRNADGTIFIKAKIADSEGILHQEKPLGVMECTTSADGMTATNFITY